MGEMSKIKIGRKVNNTIRERGTGVRKRLSRKIVTIYKGKIGRELKIT